MNFNFFEERASVLGGVESYEETTI